MISEIHQLNSDLRIETKGRHHKVQFKTPEGWTTIDANRDLRMACLSAINLQMRQGDREETIATLRRTAKLIEANTPKQIPPTAA